MANPENSPEPPKQGFKITLMQGLIGAVSLAGTTAIPLIVQRAINPPTPTPSPTQSVAVPQVQPAQMTPAPSSPNPQIEPAQMTPVTSSAPDQPGVVTQDNGSKGKNKKKGKKND